MTSWYWLWLLTDGGLSLISQGYIIVWDSHCFLCLYQNQLNITMITGARAWKANNSWHHSGLFCCWAMSMNYTIIVGIVTSSRSLSDCMSLQAWFIYEVFIQVMLMCNHGYLISLGFPSQMYCVKLSCIVGGDASQIHGTIQIVTHYTQPKTNVYTFNISTDIFILILMSCKIPNYKDRRSLGI